MTVQEKMTTREFLRNYTSISTSVTVYNRNIAKGVYFPYAEFEKIQKQLEEQGKNNEYKKSQKISLKTLSQFTFKGGKKS